MSTQEAKPLNDVKMSGDHADHPIAHHEIVCPHIGSINVYVQGVRSSSEVVILTVHDLGCDHTMYYDFINNERMHCIRDRTVWVHVDIPGQGQDAPDLPADYTFPTMQQVGDDLIHVLDQLKIREVVCFGEGAGANILIRFAVAHQERILGVVLLHCTGTTAGFMESLKDKVINWKLDHIGMNPTAEAYLVLHRFGSFSKAPDKEELKHVIENYQTMLRTKVNPKNLKKFVEAFLKRTNVADNIKRIKVPVLFVTGSKSVFHRTTHILHEHMMKGVKDKDKVELLQVSGCANVLEEKPEKFIESFQYFLQGLGLVSAIPMLNVIRQSYARSASMEEYDLPNRIRKFSGGSVSSIPMLNVIRQSYARSASMEDYDLPNRIRNFSGGSVSSLPMSRLKEQDRKPRNRSMSMEEADIPMFVRIRTMSGGEVVPEETNDKMAANVSSIPMAHLKRSLMPRMRSMSMEEADMPARARTVSGGEGNNSNGTESPLSSSVPKPDPVPETVAN